MPENEPLQSEGVEESKAKESRMITLEGKEFPVSALEIGGDTAEELQDKISVLMATAASNPKYRIPDIAQDRLNRMYESEEFQKLTKNPEQIQVVSLTLGDLGLPQATLPQIYKRAKELGLELCPAPVVPYQYIVETNKLDSDRWAPYYIAMEPSSDNDDNEEIAYVERGGNGPWFDYWPAETGRRWIDKKKFLFRVGRQEN
ncbi:MAG: hypothetical protein Q7K11_00440 [Candidatus Berkelbacteria bacterium]|nr:hypothetical protein [Candidatus Berkelbacteria bacterium]